MPDQKERVAIVTGAGTGIGQAIAVALAEAGHRVVAVGRRTEPLQDSVARAKEPGRIVAMAGDITSAADRGRVVANTVRQFGRVDILVNNAGVSSIAPLLSSTEEEWRRVMATNVDAAFFMAQAVLPHMRDRLWGRIVNIGSVFGVLALNPELYDVFTEDPEFGPKRQPAYHTSKGAMLNLTRDLAAAVAKWKVTVNTVSPGMIITDQSRDLLSDDVKRKLCGMTPVGRFGEPMEIAYAVRFLASDEAAFITGEELRVDGGWTIW
ncbi:glucose 1-dehydrogenase [Nordella sp. HKS 07]|uniref:SDR family NAD(P)-dependent oxidoreductase n=1 Tax=Nordella sp. HKS 07 TaxID=2712222 RepID=UPI0013E1E4A7|nr:glucose 1-dehydrogenase [Nordella sp. HKS 07]QIG49342.1 glucose 1-dehydrogenase [Nordella sp. HKS 07]